MLSGSREPESITPEERAMVQGLIDDTYQRFKQVVQNGRDWAHKQNKNEGKALSTDWTELRGRASALWQRSAQTWLCRPARHL